jgi:hypothetical protein
MKLWSRRSIGVVVAALASRALFIAVVPMGAVSADLSINWTAVARLLDEGQNPYNGTDFLNWPPLWMQLIYLLHRISELSSVPWFMTVKLFTAALDVAGLVLTLQLLVRDDKRSLQAVLCAWAINPSAVLVSCQHCNFDGLVAIWCVLATASLVRFERSQAVVDWLLACLFIGLGVLTKTVPVLLTPLLLGSARPLDMKVRAFGATLAFGPVALGISIIYVLGPEHISTKVLGYRSAAGWYGVTGVLYWLDAQSIAALYAKASQLLLLLGSVWIGLLAWRGCLGRSGLILSIGWLLLIIPTLGPGYGPQYVAWSLPFLALAVPLVTGTSRIALVLQLAVTAVTLIVEYGLFPSHGALWLRVSSLPQLATRSAAGSTQAGQTFIRLPLFIASLFWLTRCTLELLKLSSSSAATTDARSSILA